MIWINKWKKISGLKVKHEKSNPTILYLYKRIKIFKKDWLKLMFLSFSYSFNMETASNSERLKVGNY